MLYLILEFRHLSFQLLLPVQQALPAFMGAVAIAEGLLNFIYQLGHQIHQTVKNSALADRQQTHRALANNQKANGLHGNAGAAAAPEWKFSFFWDAKFTAPGGKAQAYPRYGNYYTAIRSLYRVSDYCIHIYHFLDTFHGRLH